ncbi:Holliday junction resolvase RecU [Paenibacillus sp. FSL H7-0326]|uniref:Holliday junction resolvase RecU n=1 Tax=Paenibacillus sp. FSL H7-0326 TaxID=1921144 RepID=UPI00096D3671|nr:Holliday junction resolvase RecU [Paenibacillus sp. FSL H7-0326]OMC71495.1 Holliday junction resolvase RecU [Paenibacillus sp. FSL H7-0326]
MSFANRGMAFENILDYSNQMYDMKGIAIINKRPTPVKVVRKTYGKVTEGYFEKSSTVDYDGVYQGRAIMFEAKSTDQKLRFDLSNLHSHQYDYLKKCHMAGGIAFLLVDFRKQRKMYLMPFLTLRSYVEASKNGGRKSIRIEDFDIHAYEVTSGRVPVDYLKAVDKIWFTEEATAAFEDSVLPFNQTPVLK